MPNEDDLPVENELPVIDRPAMEEQLQDPDLVRDVLNLLRQDMPGSVADLQAHLAAGDTGKTARLAHRIKGSMQAVVAKRAARAAARLEERAKAGDVAKMVDAGRELVVEIERLGAAVDEILGPSSVERLA